MHNSTVGGILQVSKWLGHGNARVTLEAYGHCIHDPEVHARFLRMPNWLYGPEREAPVVVPALAPRVPEAAAAIAGAFVAEVECPIAVPESAAKWLKLLIVDLWRHGDVNRALRTVGKGRDSVRYELKRWGLPMLGELEVIGREVIVTPRHPLQSRRNPAKRTPRPDARFR
jgi:hypothetical protein